MITASYALRTLSLCLLALSAAYLNQATGLEPEGSAIPRKAAAELISGLVDNDAP